MMKSSAATFCWQIKFEGNQRLGAYKILTNFENAILIISGHLLLIEVFCEHPGVTREYT